MRTNWFQLVTCTSLLLGCTGVVQAQQFTGGIRGTVSDAGGVTPGAAVTLTNEGTNIARETMSNAVGEYALVAVPPGTYALRVSLGGFRTAERRGLILGTQEFLTLDVALEVGAIEEEVTVTADAPLLDRANASTGADLDRETLDTLATHGRNAFLMSITVPTVELLGVPFFDRQQDQNASSQISMGGGGVRANNYLLDGVPITDLVGRAITNPTIEALGDVKVQVHTYDAEMGRTGGGVFNSTARSGSNQFHGSGFFQTRPVWGESVDFFSDIAGRTKEETGLADSFYRLYGGGMGGPLARNRTFFWTATEGYRQQGTFRSQQLWPTARQKTGDFSTTTDGRAPVRIFNPFCRGGVSSARCPAIGPSGTLEHPEFANAIIPAFALNPVALTMAGLWPLPNQGNENTEPNNIANPSFLDQGDMFTLKVEHKLTDAWSLSGLYLYNTTAEPAGQVMEGAIASAMDFGTGVFRRRPQALVVNNTNILDDTTVLTLRYGWTTFREHSEAGFFEGGPAALGFSSSFVNAIDPNGATLFPRLDFSDYRDVGRHAGQLTRWKQPYAVNAALSKLIGNHTLKIGGDVRRFGVESTTDNRLAGDFFFNDNFTRGPNGEGGYELASFLVGAPRAISFIPFNPGNIDVFTRYSAAYVQDDWRASSKLTVNYGLRVEHEAGLRETDNRFTVAFDQNAVSPLDALVPASARAGTPLEGRQIRGGLVFAGVDGAPTHQGDPPAVKLSPRIGVAYSLDDRTVVRGGWGLFWAPWNYTNTSHGQTGFTRDTVLTQGSDTREAPLVTLDDPFPGGLQVPIGSSLGLLTGAGGRIDFVDQTKGAPRVQQYSIDVQRELPGNMAVTVGYTGAAGEDLGFGGSSNAAININQIHPEVALAAAPGANGGWNPAFLRASIPNPFFGIPEAGEFGTRRTIQRGQLLRPFPQFRDVNQLQTTEGGRSRYHALSVKLDKRTTGWWGGRFSYTFSNRQDNLFGQASTFANRTSLPQNNYDLDAEYSTAINDAPHRLVLAPIVKIPALATSGRLARALLDGWTFSAIASFVSGMPATGYLSGGTSEANLGLFGGRQRPDPTSAPLATPGDVLDRIASADHTDARWFDAAAFANPGPGQFGTNPRTDTRARTQFRKNLDLVFIKTTRVGRGMTSQLRFELLNATNGPSLGRPANSTNQSSYGRIRGVNNFARVWQISLRLIF